MAVESLGYTEDESAEFYEFKVNMDNVAVVNESKRKGLGPEQDRLLREQFLYANVLIGLSLLLENRKGRGNGVEENVDVVETVEERIERVHSGR